MKRLSWLFTTALVAATGCQSKPPAEVPADPELLKREICAPEPRVYSGRYAVDFESSMLQPDGQKEIFTLYGAISSIWQLGSDGLVKPACFDVAVESFCHISIPEGVIPPWPLVRVSRVLRSRPVDSEFCLSALGAHE